MKRSYVGNSKIKGNQSIATSFELSLQGEFHTHVDQLVLQLQHTLVCSTEASLNQLVHPSNAQNRCVHIY